ncbi:MAG: hypothetical protein JXB30_11605 [Anaerolineae bacterium]|nr:hypothetical protein [Anaerolineae bacterium]
MSLSVWNNKRWGLASGTVLLAMGGLVLGSGLLTTSLDTFAVTIAALNLGAGSTSLALSLARRGEEP